LAPDPATAPPDKIYVTARNWPIFVFQVAVATAVAAVPAAWWHALPADEIPVSTPTFLFALGICYGLAIAWQFVSLLKRLPWVIISPYRITVRRLGRSEWAEWTSLSPFRVSPRRNGMDLRNDTLMAGVTGGETSHGLSGKRYFKIATRRLPVSANTLISELNACRSVAFKASRPLRK
jgi:hypothetical protein